MAKEIISRGERPRKYITTCNVCGCTFSFQKEDVYKMESHLNQTYASVTCPECNNGCCQCLEEAKTVGEPSLRIDWKNGVISGTVDKETMAMVMKMCPELVKDK